ncbi:four-carbon acid sugar kinase family protein [Microbacterium sp. 1P10UB]|uniref:four-carbon acid sugar kinase family protein n=1 Tax=unclassified Microbacterium TaxID=2609290 RepID=UPI0039A16A59
MKVLILDDDPTGTQSATDAVVLLRWDAERITDVLRKRDAAYLLTNTRAVDEEAAVALLESVRDDVRVVERALGEPVHVVLRGDSTLRGHVFPETEVFAGPDDVIVFVPAFPQGGRTTRGGEHYVRIEGVEHAARDTEFSKDPVFPFETSYLPDYVRARTDRLVRPVSLDEVRIGALATIVAEIEPGTVIVPDAVTDDDIRIISDGVRAAWATGAHVVVRSGSPLAAALAGVESTGLLRRPLVADPRPTLLVCGSHTAGATRQLGAVAERWGAPVEIDTDAAMADAAAEAARLSSALLESLRRDAFAAFASARDRRDDHDTLAHGEQVMAALTGAVRAVRAHTPVVVSKGGITSADVARVGLGADRAVVVGQVLPGVSVWSLVTPEGVEVLYVVVPGNVGDSSTIVDVLDAVRAPEPARHAA